MLGSPWDLVLTIAFSFTALVCGVHFLRHRVAGTSDGGELSDSAVIDANHGLMSIAMIAMIWLPMIEIVTWAQVALFAVLALSVLPLFGRATDGADRLDLVGHITLDIAMMWMLAAMPLLMAGVMDASAGSAHAAHHMTAGEAIMETPFWADVVNVIFIVVSAAAAVWWLFRLIVVKAHRLHLACHAVMAVGMSGMLFLMNV